MTLREDVVYLDNAATTWPKPASLGQAMARFLDEIGANPGRSGHRLSVEAARTVYAAREAVAALVHEEDPLRVAFGANATHALNTALLGLLRPGDHVVTSGMEHNSVMRPLRALEREGVAVSIAPCSPEGVLDPDDVARLIQPATRLIAINHASNVVGTLLPLREIGRIAREHGLLMLVDTAQTAGAVPIHMGDDYVDLLAFTGHKALFGPMGTGGLVVGERVPAEQLRPLMRGGTGSRSEREEQPDFLPDMLESGTANAVGLAGLAAGIGWVAGRGVEAIRTHEVALCRQLLHGLCGIPGVRVYGTQDPERQVATVSFNIDGMEASEVGLRLDEEHGVLCRVGLHCAPAAHRTIGTFPHGTVRFGLGALNTEEHVLHALEAVRCLAREAMS